MNESLTKEPIVPEWLPDIFGRRRFRLVQALTTELASNQAHIERLVRIIAEQDARLSSLQTGFEQSNSAANERFSDIDARLISLQTGVDHLNAVMLATERARARYLKEVNCRKAIAKIIADYFVLGDPGHQASIPFESVKVDSNPAWMPEILARSEVSEPEFALFKHFAGDTGTILDIGANYGYAAASMWAAGATSKIMSFEPNPWHGACLAKIKEMKPGQFDFCHIGLSANPSAIGFVMPVIEDIGISALNTASTDSSIIWALQENILQHMMDDHPDLESPSLKFSRTVWNTKRLDDVVASATFDVDLEHISAMKIDVEGFEAEVLAGAPHTLQSHKPLIMIEGANRNADVVACLSGHGYRYAEFAADDPYAFLTNKQSSRDNGFFLHADKLTSYQATGLLRSAP